MTTTTLKILHALYARLGVKADHAERAPPCGATPRELSLALKHELTFARTVHSFELARREIVDLFALSDVRRLLQPEMFPSPHCSIASRLCAVDKFVPPAPLDDELANRLLGLTHLQRVAFADALESIYYYELPGGSNIVVALERYGMTVRAA